MTPDHLPRVTDIGPDAISIHGYSGRGIAPGTVFGKATADWVAKGDRNAFPVKIGSVETVPFSRASGSMFEAGATLTHLLAARV